MRHHDSLSGEDFGPENERMKLGEACGHRVQTSVELLGKLKKGRQAAHQGPWRLRLFESRSKCKGQAREEVHLAGGRHGQRWDKSGFDVPGKPEFSGKNECSVAWMSIFFSFIFFVAVFWGKKRMHSVVKVMCPEMGWTQSPVG